MDTIDDGPTVRTDPATDEEHRRHRRGIVLGAGIGALVLMATVALVVAVTGRSAPPQDPIGDPRTVEPCALLSGSWFDSDATLYRNHRLPQQCAAVVGPLAADGTVENSTRVVTAQFVLADPPSRAPIRTDGDLAVYRGADETACARLVVLPDGRGVQMAATGPDPCRLTEAATDGAITALQHGPLPRREPEPADALTRRSVCDLVDPRQLADVPGLDPRSVTRGWADWACRWGTTGGAQVQAAVYRTGELGPATEPDGRTVVIPASDNGLVNGCTAAIPHRAYRTPSGGMKVESLQITASLPADPGAACDVVRRLAAADGGVR